MLMLAALADSTVLVALVSGAAATATAFVRRGGTRSLAQRIGEPNGQGNVVAMLETTLGLLRQVAAAQHVTADELSATRARLERRLDLVESVVLGAGPAERNGTAGPDYRG